MCVLSLAQVLLLKCAHFAKANFGDMESRFSPSCWIGGLNLILQNIFNKI